MWCLFFQYSRLHTIPITGINHSSNCLCIGLCHILNLFTVFCDNLNDRDIEFCCKLKVTVVMSRYTHNSSCTVISQYIIR